MLPASRASSTSSAIATKRGSSSRLSLLAASIMALLANLNRSPDTRPYTLYDFNPLEDKPRDAGGSYQRTKQTLAALAAANRPDRLTPRLAAIASIRDRNQTNEPRTVQRKQ